MLVPSDAIIIAILITWLHSSWPQSDNYKHSKHGHINSPESFLIAEDLVRKFNLECKAELCHIQQTKPGEFFVVCVDEMASRVHEVGTKLYETIISVFLTPPSSRRVKHKEPLTCLLPTTHTISQNL